MEKKFNYYLSRLVVVASMLIYPIAVSAQDLKINTTVNGTDKQPAVKVDGVNYATVGAKLTVGVQFTPPTQNDKQRKLTVTKCDVTLNGSVKSISGGNGSAEFDLNTSLSDSQAEVTLEYTYEENISADPENPLWEKKNSSVPSGKSEKITIFSAPSSKSQTDQGKQYLNNASYPVTINTEGGNPNGWKYYLNEKEQGSNVVNINKPTTVPKDDTYKVVAKNFAPDGTTEWFSNEYKYPIYFYNAPSVYFAKKPSETNYYKNTTNSEWEIKSSGGATDWVWEIEWNGGQNVAPAKDWKYCPYTIDVTSDQTGRKITYKATAKYEGHTLWTSGDVDVTTINVFPEIKHSESLVALSCYIGEKINFSSEAKNGYPGGWTYEWKKDNVSFGTPNAFVEDTPGKAGTYIYTLVATNKYNGNVWDKYEIPFTANVYDLPSVGSSYEVTAYDTNGEEVTADNPESASTTYTDKVVKASDYYMMSGDNVKFTVKGENGMPDGWTYSVDIKTPNNGTTTINVPTGEYMFNHTGSGDYQVVITATNGKDKLMNPYTATVSRTFKVIDKPYSQAENFTTNVYSGNGTTLKVGEEASGNGLVWNVNWKDNGETGWSREIQATTVTTKETSKDYTCSVGCTISGAKRYEVDKTFTVVTWPSPNVTTKECIIARNTEGATVNTPSDDTYETNMETPSKQKANEYQMIVGDEVFVSVDKPTNGIKDAWEYRILLDGQLVSSDNQYTFKPETSKERYTLTIEAVNGQRTNKDASYYTESPFKSTVTMKYVVYEKPDVITDADTINIYAGKSYTLNKNKESIIGGSENGWTYSWSGDQGNGSGAEQDIHTDKSCESKDTLTNTLTAEYKLEGMVRHRASRTYSLVVWPEPKVTGLTVKLHDKDINTVKGITYYDMSKSTSKDIDIECYSGDYVDIAYSVAGGYDSDNAGWYYIDKYGNEEKLSVLDKEKVTGSGTDVVYQVTASPTGYLEEIKTLKFKNVISGVKHDAGVGETVWKSVPFNLKIKRWATPSISDNAKDSINSASWKNSSSLNRVHVYAGGQDVNDVKLNISHKYGNTDGWTYVWKEDGVTKSNNDTQWTYVPSTSSSYSDKKITVEIANSIGDNYGLKDTINYCARIWKKANVAESMVLKDVNQNRIMTDDVLSIRSGNNLEISVSPITGGYQSNNYYDWSAGSIRTTANTYDWNYQTPATSTTTEGKTTRIIQLHNYNMGPYNRIWEGRDDSQTITIYNRPQTPAGLVKKGNGASGTLIAVHSIKDEDLINRDYYLTFGYLDANNREHVLDRQKQETVGEIRWNRGFSSSEVNTNTNKFFVYATWVYDGGRVAVTSGRRFTNTGDESWDGSVYGIANVRAAGYIVEDLADGIEVVHESSSTSEDGHVYNLTGQRVSANAKGIVIKNGKKYIVK